MDELANEQMKYDKPGLKALGLGAAIFALGEATNNPFVSFVGLVTGGGALYKFSQAGDLSHEHYDRDESLTDKE